MKKRSSSQIKNIIIIFIIILILTFIGLILFLFNVDIKEVQPERQLQTNNDNGNTNINNQDTLNESYEIVKQNFDVGIQFKLVNNEVIFEVIDKDKFSKAFPKNVIDINVDDRVEIHENTIEDIDIAKINSKYYLIVLTNNGLIGTMEIEEAVNSEVYRLKNELISFGSKVIRLMNARIDDKELLVVVTEDGKKYDLSKFVEQK